MNANSASLNPFKPGSGKHPPYLAGRDSHLKQFATMLATAIAEGRGETVVMYGPRGVGKTVLLKSFAEHADERQAVVLCATPAEYGDSSSNMVADLMRPSAGDDRWGRVAAWLQNLLSLGLSVAGMGFPRPAKVSANGTRTRATAPLARTLAAACRRDGRARVLLLDEAHTMPPEAARVLLNVAQATTIRDEAPFVLLLAGTPGLPGHLRSVGATFVERARKVGVGLLDNADAMAAIRIPLERSGMTIPDGLLAEVAEDAQRYPYFLQLWGEALWGYANAHAISQIDRAIVERAAAVVDGTRINFYDERHQDLIEAGLTDAAVAVAAAFGAAGADSAGIHLDQIRAVIERHLTNTTANKTADAALRKERAIAMGKELVRAGFIWQPPETDVCIPGIPSLMTYILERARMASR